MNTWEKLKERVEKVQVAQDLEPEDSMYRICRECNAKREGILLKLWEGKTSKEWDALYKVSQSYGILLNVSLKLNTLCNEYKGMMG